MLRRGFLKKLLNAGGMLALGPGAHASPSVPEYSEGASIPLYRAVNGTPANNLTKVMEMMGGIEQLFGSNDVVVIKPNVQWWSQGAPNLLALKTFVDLIMQRTGGFKGEVIIAENCHRGNNPGASSSAGWSQNFQRNSDIDGVNNFNDLCALLKQKYGARFTRYHLLNVANGAKRIYSPADGEGYVYCDGTNGVPLIKYDNGIKGDGYRATIMTYPIIKTDKGTIVDLKNGVWENGQYTNQPIRYINFAALNHHSSYCGATSAVKNYFGVVDLSGGPDPSNNGRLTGDYYNFHSFPFNKWAPGPKPGMLGAEVGVFLRTIRKPYLNITTAEWIGLSSRTHLPVAHTRAVLACADPVALDYHATKYILYPNSKIGIHNPDDKNGPLREYLMKCAEEGGGFFDEKNVKIESYNLKTNTFQKDNNLTVLGDIQWGYSLKPLLKYVVFRFL